MRAAVSAVGCLSGLVRWAPTGHQHCAWRSIVPGGMHGLRGSAAPYGSVTADTIKWDSTDPRGHNPESRGDSIILGDLQTFASRLGPRAVGDGAQSFAIRSANFAKTFSKFHEQSIKLARKSLKLDQNQSQSLSRCKLSQVSPLSRTCKLSLARAAFAAGRPQRANFRILSPLAMSILHIALKSPASEF